MMLFNIQKISVFICKNNSFTVTMSIKGCSPTSGTILLVHELSGACVSDCEKHLVYLVIIKPKGWSG